MFTYLVALVPEDTYPGHSQTSAPTTSPPKRGPLRGQALQPQHPRVQEGRRPLRHPLGGQEAQWLPELVVPHPRPGRFRARRRLARDLPRGLVRRRVGRHADRHRPRRRRGVPLGRRPPRSPHPPLTPRPPPRPHPPPPTPPTPPS